ncbi:hypothetical protein ES708_25190 [subsurface metagenome]
MGIDIRFPIGLMFTIFGLVLTIFGLVTNSNAEMYKRSLEININLWTGLVILVFGILMLIFALKGKKTGKSK